MTCETPCKNCDRKGLPILFTRYAAAYIAREEGMQALKSLQPSGQFQHQPAGLALQTAMYNIRMLRAGYLYVHIDRGISRTPDEWKGYAVHPHGYLSEFDVMLPETAQANIACARDSRQANNSMVWVENSRHVKKLWYLFHSEPIDPDHLMREIAPNIEEYMQSFDIAAWVNGNAAQKESCGPDQLDTQVVEFAALKNDALREAMEPQLHGLMGSNALERGWGDYMEVLPAFAETAGGAVVGRKPRESVLTKKGPTYSAAHQARLEQMAQFLKKENGAVLACTDAIGIAQELGHLQAEAQQGFTRWQISPAKDSGDVALHGLHASISNAWAFQVANDALAMRSLLANGIAERVEQRFEYARSPVPLPLPRDPTEAAAEKARREKAREKGIQNAKERESDQIAEKFTTYFDLDAAKAIIAEQEKAYEKSEKLKSKLGADHIAWLDSQALAKALACFNVKEVAMRKANGGLAMSAHLMQCMAGIEHSTQGQAWLKSQSVTGTGPLARSLCMGSSQVQQLWKDLLAAQLPEEAEPKPEPSTPNADMAADMSKRAGTSAGIGDKTLALQEALQEARVNRKATHLVLAFGARYGTLPAAKGLVRGTRTLAASQALVYAAWPAHIASLLGVKMMQQLNGLPVSKAEAMVARYAGLSGLITLGDTAQTEIKKLNLPLDQQNALMAAKQRMVEVAHGANTKARTPRTRASALAALLDMGQAVIKYQQLKVKGDTRTVVEMGGSLLQGIGSVLDWRAKAYEETVYKAVKALDLSTADAMEKKALDTLQELQLRRLRLLAFRFLAPAALISIYWDAVDAKQSKDRKQYALAAAQWASAVGTIFAITATGMAAVGVGSALVVSIVGIVGATLTMVSVIAIWSLKEEDWVNWLIDIPLNERNRGKKPLHKNLQQSMQQFVNAKAAMGT